MKQRTLSNERGQALVMIALALVVLFGFTALVIDGTSAYSDRRHAQNAADTSALAAALAIVRGNSYTSAAFTRAASNGYDNNGTTNVVEVHLCSDAGATCVALPSGAKPSEYVQVIITSHVKMRFAQILGKTELVNKVQAVTHATPYTIKPLFSGQAMVSLAKGDCNSPGFDYGGSTNTTVTGSGIFVNQNCNPALDTDGGGQLSVPCYDVVGTVDPATHPITTGPCTNHTGEQQISDPFSTFPAPDINCGSTNGKLINGDTLTPGNYSGSFPPAQAKYMQSGVYCISAGNQSFSLNGGQSLTGSDVLIWMKSGSVDWTSGGINLSAISDTSNPLHGLLLYMSPTDPDKNCSTVKIAGNGNSSFVGTILTPCSLVTLSGGSSGGTTLQNQIIADKINITGNNQLTINYVASQQWQPPIPPTIEVNQ